MGTSKRHALSSDLASSITGSMCADGAPTSMTLGAVGATMKGPRVRALLAADMALLLLAPKGIAPLQAHALHPSIQQKPETTKVDIR